MARQQLRRLVADGRLYLYSMRWRADLDGERVIAVALYHAETGDEHRPRGQPMRAKFLTRAAEWIDTAVAMPADVRAVLDRALALGWDGRREGWLLPASGLERPELVLSGPTRLREWASEHRVQAVHFDDPALAERIAGDLGLPPVPAAHKAAEAQWRDERRYLLRSRFGRSVHLYTLGVAELVAALAVIARRAPRLGVSVAGLSASLVGADTIPAGDIVPPEHWAAQPGARRYPGSRETDVVWAFDAPDGPRIEAYQFHADEPDRLWRWTSLHDAGSIERRFPRPSTS